MKDLKTTQTFRKFLNLVTRELEPLEGPRRLSQFLRYFANTTVLSSGIKVE